MSPPTMFTFARSMSAGESTTRLSTATRDSATWRAIRAWIRSAYASRAPPSRPSRVELAGGVALRQRRELLELDPEDPACRRARARGRRPAAGRRPSSPRPAASRAPPRSPPARRRRGPASGARSPSGRAARRPASAAAPRARSGSASLRGRSGSGAPRRPARGPPSRSPYSCCGVTFASTARAASIVSPSAVRRPSRGRSTTIRSTSRPVSQRAARVADDPGQRLDELDAAAARHRHSAELDRDADHLRHEPRRRRVGAETRVQHPRREQAAGALGVERLAQSSRGTLTSTLPVNSTSPRRPSRRYAFQPSPRPSRDQSSVESTPKARSAFGMNSDDRARLPSPGGRAPSTFASCEVVRKRASPSGNSVAGRQLGVQVLDARAPRAPPQLRVRGRAR